MAEKHGRRFTKIILRFWCGTVSKLTKDFCLYNTLHEINREFFENSNFYFIFPKSDFVLFFLQLKTTMVQNPVIFLPTHRSYADFILMAFLCFNYDIEIPAVIAGMGKNFTFLFFWTRIIPKLNFLLVYDICCWKLTSLLPPTYRFPTVDANNCPVASVLLLKKKKKIYIDIHTVIPDLSFKKSCWIP